MLNLTSLTPADIEAMSYNQLIGLVKETNRPPGGRRSIVEIATRCFLRRESRVLEIGTSTGTTAIELGRVVGCSVVGIDINENSLAEARERAALHGLDNVTFRQADATNLPFGDGSFDMVFCGNVTSLIDDKQKALSEYLRVTRMGGFLAAIPMYYVVEPPLEMVERVRKAIQVNIPIAYRSDAVRFYAAPQLELFDAIDFRFRNIPEQEVRAFCREILARPHLQALRADTSARLGEIYLQYMLLFRENLSHMGFTIMLLRRTAFVEDPELFVADRVIA